MTGPAFLLAPVACAVVLLLSGIAKYSDPEATRSAFVAMRVPAALSSPTAVRLLPVAEIALGVLLLVTWGRALAVTAAGVTVLFATYWVLVLLVLRRGEEVDCGCFGAAGDATVTSATLARNTVLLGLAVVATVFGAQGSGAVPALRDLGGGDLAWLLMAAAVTAAAVLVVGVRRGSTGTPGPVPVPGEQLADYERTPIPFAVLSNEDHETVTLRKLADERPQLLLQLSSSCASCHAVAAQVPAWIPRLGPVEVQLVFTETLEDLPPEVRPEGARLWFDVERGAYHAFASRTPSAVLLGADGLLAGGPVAGSRDVAQFVDDIVAEIGAAQNGAAETEADQAAEPAETGDPEWSVRLV